MGCDLLASKKCVIDTNILMNDIDLSEFETVYVPMTVLEELDKLKMSDNENKAFRARSGMRKLIEYQNVISYVIQRSDIPLEIAKPDNAIIASMKYVQTELDEDAVALSMDINVIEKCRCLGINVRDYNDYTPKEIYKGYKKVNISNEQLAYIYEHINENIYDLNIGEYLIIYDLDDNFIECRRWNGYKLTTLQYSKCTANTYIDAVSPQDEVQRCAFDSLYNDQLTVLYGKQGSGKTLLSLSYALHQLTNGKCRKLWIVATNVPLKGAFEIGYLPGDLNEKLLDSNIGNILKSKLGDSIGVEYLMEANKLEIVPTVHMRGMEFSEDDIVIVTEGQNLSPYICKTIISRCKDGCKIIVEGDILEQKDVNIGQSGMERIIEVFKNHEDFGCIKLKYNYRSKFAELIDQI